VDFGTSILKMKKFNNFMKFGKTLKENDRRKKEKHPITAAT